MADLIKTSKLSPRERQICDCIARGLANKEIANELNLSVNTVKQYIHQIRMKSPIVMNRRRLVSEAARRQYEAQVIGRLHQWIERWQGRIPIDAENEVRDILNDRIMEMLRS